MDDPLITEHIAYQQLTKASITFYKNLFDIL